MRMTQNNSDKKTLKIILNDKPVMLIFSDKSNAEAADFIKKALLNVYLIKAV